MTINPSQSPIDRGFGKVWQERNVPQVSAMLEAMPPKDRAQKLREEARRLTVYAKELSGIRNQAQQFRNEARVVEEEYLRCQSSEASELLDKLAASKCLMAKREEELGYARKGTNKQHCTFYEVLYLKHATHVQELTLRLKVIGSLFIIPDEVRAQQEILLWQGGTCGSKLTRYRKAQTLPCRCPNPATAR